MSHTARNVHSARCPPRPPPPPAAAAAAASAGEPRGNADLRAAQFSLRRRTSQPMTCRRFRSREELLSWAGKWRPCCTPGTKARRARGWTCSDHPVTSGRRSRLRGAREHGHRAARSQLAAAHDLLPIGRAAAARQRIRPQRRAAVPRSLSRWASPRDRGAQRQRRGPPRGGAAVPAVAEAGRHYKEVICELEGRRKSNGQWAIRDEQLLEASPGSPRRPRPATRRRSAGSIVMLSLLGRRTPSRSGSRRGLRTSSRGRRAATDRRRVVR